MAATVTSVWGLGVFLGVAVLLTGTIVIGLARRSRRRRRQREQAMDLGLRLAEQGLVPGTQQGLSTQPAQPAQPARPVDPPVEPSHAELVPGELAQAEPTRVEPAQAEPGREPMTEPVATAIPAAAIPAADESGGLEHVTVRVRNPAEEPLDHAVLTVTELDGRQVARAESGGAGDYDLGPLPYGNYVLIVRCSGYRPYAQVLELRDGLPRRTRVELGSDSGLTGVVRRKDGEPVAAATVTLKDDHGVVMTARTGPDGDYRITGVRPGAYTLLVTARVCRPVELAVDVPERGLSRQDVELIGGAHVQGTVRVDQGRKVLPGTRILLLDERGEVLATTDADEQGRYRFSEVNAGEYTVCATPPSPAVSTVRIDGGLVHELDLELRQTN